MKLLCANRKQGYTSANFQASIILLAMCVFGGQILTLAWRHIAVPILFWLKTSVISLQRSHSKLDHLWDPPCKMLLGTVCNLRKCKVCVLFDLNGVQLNSLYMWIHTESVMTWRSAKDVKMMIPWVKQRVNIPTCICFISKQRLARPGWWKHLFSHSPVLLMHGILLLHLALWGTQQDSGLCIFLHQYTASNTLTNGLID